MKTCELSENSLPIEVPVRAYEEYGCVLTRSTVACSETLECYDNFLISEEKLLAVLSFQEKIMCSINESEHQLFGTNRTQNLEWRPFKDACGP